MLDSMIFDKMDYYIIEVEGSGLFDADSYGLQPSPRSFACWKGFVTQYIVKNSKLYLNKLTISLSDKKYPAVNGKLPSDVDSLMGLIYRDINLPVSFTGRLRVGSNLIEDYFGYNYCAAAYEKVQELLFEGGSLKHSIDISSKMEEKRRTGDIMA